MDGIPSVIFFFFCNILLLTRYGSAYPLCTDSRSPFIPKSPLAFCQYSGRVCCNSTEDVELQKQFKSLNVSGYGCASLLKSTLCSRCDPFSAELYRIGSAPRVVPVLCNSTVLANSSQSQLAATDFCSKVWDECHNLSISNSPFTKDKAGSVVNSSSRLTELWESKVSLNSSESPSLPSGICLEKMENGSYLNMVAHPDGSNRVFLANQQGKIWLATVYYDTELGMMGIAFHPNFQQNGRFFASFNCDKVKWPECSGDLPSENGAQPCQYHSIIAEFSANGTSSQPSQATSVQPQEVRRIFTMGLPFAAHHGGQILFGPEDGYLYFMMGDGGSIGDPYNFSQNKKSLLGKIMRLDIDNIPSGQTITDRGLWGNYSVPVDNPFSEDEGLEPEIWALGLRNPWRCTFDADRPSYFLCADVGQDQYEEVDLITKGGNYGWRVYEGPSLYYPPTAPGGNTSASSINPIFPVMGYNHSEVNNGEGSASITGGHFYRSTTDPCMHGRYLFSDLYAGAIWAGTENPKDSGNFTSTKLPASCAHAAPIPCTTVAGSSFPSLGFIFSFGQDNRKDMFILASSGVYRIARPSRCNYFCPVENVTAPLPPSPSPSHSAGKRFSKPPTAVLLNILISASLLLLLYFQHI
ncbi:HIPL1 protein [Salix suchowensis]|nr:HIPL1 protein [Salix suchowensis]